MTTTSLLNVPGLSKRTDAFKRAFADLIDRTGYDGDRLAQIISFESGFDPQAKNPMSGASGLIQFMPSTAIRLDTTIEAIRAMTDLQQLPLVEKYFKNLAGVIEPRDLYLAVFMPRFMRHDDSDVISTKGEKVYDQNAGLDTDHDGVLTVGNVRGLIEGRVIVAKAKPRIAVPVGSSSGGNGSPGSSGSPGAGEQWVAGILIACLTTAALLHTRR